MGSNRPTTYRHAAKQVLAPLLPALPAARRWRQRLARERFIIRLKTLALEVDATVEVDIADDVTIDRPPLLEIYRGSWNRLRVDRGTRIGDGVRFSLRGGTLDIGAGTEIRRLGSYQIQGAARIGDGVVMSSGIVLHCKESVAVGDLTIVGEYTTIADSHHRRTPSQVAVHHSVRSRPVVIGRNVWVGAHAVVTAGVTVGDQAFVGAGAVVTKDVEPGWLVGGIPARPIRQLSTEV